MRRINFKNLNFELGPARFESPAIVYKELFLILSLYRDGGRRVYSWQRKSWTIQTRGRVARDIASYLQDT